MPVKGELKGNGVPVKLWTELASVESEALTQLKNVSGLPFVMNHVAVMPDCHVGKGATVGSVIATQGAVIPSAVGVDIGCGMSAVKLKGITVSSLGDLAVLRHSIERSVPTGFSGNSRVGKDVKGWEGWDEFSKLHPDIQKEMSDAQTKLGSLGGGNHFIEICKDPTDNVWVMLHSGSRNIGLKIANIYIKKAKELMSQMYIQLPDRELAYLPATDISYSNYLRDLNWAQSYAFKNRELMRERILKDIFFAVGKEPFDLEMEVNCHHNFAAMEHHYGQNVLITRKGAIRARVGELGIIPGSMGTKSFIVRGLGNPLSFESSSHGAGRRMSRSAAKRTFTEEDIAKQLAGIECRKDKGIIDELPGAYKDVDVVMANQNDLVEVVTELKQIMCIKG